MERPAPNPPQHRDLVYCHQCEDEWYRDEHGLQCPHCQSDFTEIIEAGHDPREEELRIPVDTQHPLHDHNPWENAPDPDEDDIDHFQWQRGGQPGQYHATFNRTYDMNLGGRGQGQAQGGSGGLLGMLGNMVGGMVNSALQQQGPQGQRQQYAAGEHGMHEQGTPGSAPGSPRGEQQQGHPGGTTVRHVHGPGYSFTMTTSSNMGGNLYPRNAHEPQPFNAQPDHMDNMMRQLFQNIGAFPGQRGPPGFGFHDDMHDGGMPFPGALLQQLLGGQHGDAVYSQEALDRIVTQLMEQHQTGNAPGPASQAAIDSLPKRPITEQDFGDQGKAECSICMADVELGEQVTVLPCSHWFHDECVRHWLNEHDTCPHCRQGIMPKENDQNRAGQEARAPSQAPLHDHGSPEYLRTNVPGAFPFPQSGSGAQGPSTTGGSGTRASPFTVPESPSLSRGNSSQQGSGSRNQGVFNRMRDAFGGGSGTGSRS